MLSFWILFSHWVWLPSRFRSSVLSFSERIREFVEHLMHALTSQPCSHFLFTQIRFCFESSNWLKNMHDWFQSLWFISVSIFFFLGPSRLFESRDVLFRSLSLINRSDRDLSPFKLPSGFSSRFLTVIAVSGWRLSIMKWLCLAGVWSFVLKLLGLFTIGGFASRGFGQDCFCDLSLFKCVLLMSLACFFHWSFWISFDLFLGCTSYGCCLWFSCRLPYVGLIFQGLCVVRWTLILGIVYRRAIVICFMF